MTGVSLEDIKEIEALAECREKARELTRKAHDALELLPLERKYIALRADPTREQARHKELTKRRDRHWHGAGGAITKSTLLLARIMQLRHHDKSIDEVLSDPCWRVVRDELLTESLESLRQDEPDDIPALRAARILRTLVAAQSSVATETGFAALRRVLEELYSSANRDYSVGGASAGKSGRPTAFITSECVRSLLSFARLLERTGALLESIASTIGEADLRKERVEHRLEPKWSYRDLEAVILNAQCNLHERMNNTLVEVCIDQIRSLGTAKTPRQLAERMRGLILTPLAETLERAIAAVRANEGPVPQPAPSAAEFRYRQLAHWFATEYARMLLESIRVRATAISELVQRAADHRASSRDSEKSIRGAAELFKQGAQEVRLLTAPARRFFGRVLDREIAQAKTFGEFAADIPELLFAAAGLGSTARNWRDSRIDFALGIAMRRLARRAPWQPGKPFVADEHGFTLHPIGAQVSAAALRIAQESGRLLSDREAWAVLQPILETLEETPEGGCGWRHDHEAGHRRSQWVTAVVAASLHKFIQTLDRQINTRILKMFRVRQPNQIFEALHLERICYTDYAVGALGAASASRSRGGRRQSGALVLAKLRAHLVARRESPSISFIDESCSRREFSAIFHGPPGTGKTSLMEGLSLACSRPIVQVTPSDIIAGGQEGAGHHVDLVFRALSKLTDAVVIFDEFDQLLSKRSGEPRAPQNLFELIAPSVLTKLRDLNDGAAENRVAYGLATNFLRILDPAVTREGRFGRRVGVYYVDVLARATRMLGVMSRRCFEIGSTVEDPQGSSKTWLAVLGERQSRNRLARAVHWTAWTSAKDFERLILERRPAELVRGSATPFESPVFRYVLLGDKGARRFLRTEYAQAKRSAEGLFNASKDVLDASELQELGRLSELEQQLEAEVTADKRTAWKRMSEFLDNVEP